MPSTRRNSFFTVLLLIASIACIVTRPGNQSTQQPRGSTPTQAQSVPPPTPLPANLLPTVSGADVGFSANNPVPRGSALSWFGVTLAVTEVISPATDIILGASPQDPTPSPGSQYLLVRVSIACVVGSDDYRDYCGLATTLTFQLMGMGGTTYPQVLDLVNLPNSFDPAAFLAGQAAEGYLAFMVPATSRELVLVITRYMFEETYFALE